MKADRRRRKEDEKQRLLAEALKESGYGSPYAESGEEAFLLRARLSSQGPPPAPVGVELDISGDEAFLRRGRLTFGAPPVDAAQSDTEPVRSIIIQATTVVLLRNMVGLGDVDDSLHEDVAEEAEKFGSVEKCLVFEVPGGQVPPEEAVRVFVKYKNVESARQGSVFGLCV
ncbi:Splicing factor 45 [Gonapodya sp. JEL0774]|nr:Splicing factor 45 [Gonapodya sp. JEL0774]